MSTDREPLPEVGGSFQQRLQRLRIKIDPLPEAQRSHLVDLVETIARQRRHLQNRVSHHHDAD